MLSLLLLAATTTPLPQTAVPLTKQTQIPAKPNNLFSMVASKMSAEGKPTFTRYVDQTFMPQVRAEAQAEASYRQQLQALVAAPTLDVDAAQRLIDQRKRASDAATATIRSGAFAMIKSLPATDRKLALTAIFADARLHAPRPAPSASPTPAARGK